MSSFYSLVRLIFWIVVWILAGFMLRNTKIFKQKPSVSRLTASGTLVLGVVGCLILTSVSALFPVENLFINFKSPEAVLRYTSFDVGEISYILDGNSSCLINYKKIGGATASDLVLKSEAGYKISNTFSVKVLPNRLKEGRFLMVQHVVGTDDYYVLGTTVLPDGEFYIVDCYGEEIKNIDTTNAGLGDKFVSFEAFVEGYTDDYYVLINGEKYQ